MLRHHQPKISFPIAIGERFQHEIREVGQSGTDVNRKLSASPLFLYPPSPSQKEKLELFLPQTVNRKAEKGVAAEKVFQRSNTATYSTFKFTDRFDSHRKDETSSQVKCQQRKF
ncbi:hypothetical protein OUZ56_007654 [Daphnia magna]|uniref:Uncharacterized protein n=1 Tax=Daphnia magna TaxID=35525 RepID=A0ABR0AAL3_9CRUS|nr:hypothetical protein OUZ56_007654 [Daphnia magna]